jgi:hypothetical protein
MSNTAHVFGPVDDCWRCVNCESLPGRDPVCPAAFDHEPEPIPEDWEDYADEGAHWASEWTAEQTLAYWD